ncbi:hypothetical protein BGZ96_010723 [Linnemannia gamsii]|uniref:Ricin B lectin domain-containing protein n=1 Tax=Linnemannia gamsii TaxID=64522 RepID=A0ABQ7JU50_9FUNG|nr:hypothetical protein BGZ96_010723 [Linnemannia gamsii]
MKDFPENDDFFIGLRYTDFVLDAAQNSLEPGSQIVLWTRRNEDNENQKWRYENKMLRNVKTGLVLSARELNGNVAVDQQHGSESETQRFEYYDHTISVNDHDHLVLGSMVKSEGTQIALVPRDNDSVLQQWVIIQ